MCAKPELFTPGPVKMPDTVYEAMDSPQIGHRSPNFENLYETLQFQIAKLYHADGKSFPVLITGSGTAANEAVLSLLSDVTPLVIQNGEFGERLSNILDAYNRDHYVLEFPWGQYPDLRVVRSTLESNPDIDMVAMVYHETSTSMINPVKVIGNIASNFNCLFFVDTVSAIGAEKVDLASYNIDIATGVANKALAGPTGISFVCMDNSIIDELNFDPQTSYLDLEEHIEYATERSQTPHTPAIRSIRGLKAALDAFFEEGEDTRLARYNRNSTLIREWAESDSRVELYLPPDQSSNALTSILLPSDIDVGDFIEELESLGYLAYPGKKELYEEGVVQLATMGEIYEEDTKRLVETLDTCLDTVVG